MKMFMTVHATSTSGTYTERAAVNSGRARNTQLQGRPAPLPGETQGQYYARTGYSALGATPATAGRLARVRGSAAPRISRRRG